MKYIIALGIIFIAFIIIVIFLTINIKYTFYENNIQDKEPIYRLGDWYFNSLTYKEQLLYDEIVTSIENISGKTQNLPYKFTEEEFERIITSVMYDNPQLFYVIDYETQLYATSKRTYVKFNYYDKKSNIKSMIKEFDDKISEIINILGNKSKFESDFDIEVAIHDYLVRNCRTTDADDYIYNTAYGVLISGQGYSGGYAEAFKLLMNKYGLICYIIEGQVDNQRHLWNMVYINDSFYHVDVTWNDGDIMFAEDLLFHAYFNLSSTVIMEDHYIADVESLPAAYTETHYYVVKDLYIYDLEELKSNINRIILNAVAQGNMFIELYTYFGADVYEANEFQDIVINSIKQINQSDSGIVLDESYRLYKAADNKNIFTIQLYNLEN